ncbi:ACT domain-containing protein [Sphingosinicella terrae]|jgi:acetolactate synthase regulatory subunit|uniref:ACT domain-containing protein n=1 Tax=Sphingosinicella terrae TaxID=2172047 RepID=UPI000E0DED9F|nr:ACT domain-containing protein [Sphingosinicella terrae]
MNERLVVEFAPAEGAVLRMLGLVERRGFRVSGLGMSEQPCGSQASLSLELVARDAGRRVEVLGLQLQRLHGVSRVTHASAVARERAA